MLINLKILRENLVFDIRRFYTGSLILLSCIFFYISKYDYIFFIIINLLIILDLKILVPYNKKIFYFFLSIFLITLFFLNDFFYRSNVFLFTILLLIIFTFISKKNLSIFFIIIILFFSILLFNLINYDRDLFYLIIFISFINDSLAYFFGNLLKGPLILPSISPKKTWSGTSISFFLSSVVLFYLGYTIFTAALLSISLFFGDIYFSFIKRKLKLKDFSNILGSHGGILDRLDSMFLITIVVTFITFNL